MELQVVGKKWETRPIRYMLRQGENLSDQIVTIMDRIYNGLDRGALTWSVRGYTEKETLAEAVLSRVADNGRVLLRWDVGRDFTQADGAMMIELRGFDTQGDVLTVIPGGEIIVWPDAASAYAPPPDVWDQVLMQAQESAQDAAGSADEAKAEADRLVQMGANFKILGIYPSLEGLQSAVTNPARGDAYGVGVDPDIYAYIYDGTQWSKGQKLGTVDMDAYYTKVAAEETFYTKTAAEETFYTKTASDGRFAPIQWMPNNWKAEEAPPRDYSGTKTTIFYSTSPFGGLATPLVRTDCYNLNLAIQTICFYSANSPVKYRLAAVGGTWQEWQEVVNFSKDYPLTLINGWQKNADWTYNGCRKMGDLVVLNVGVKNAAASSQPPFTLPVGCRPSDRLVATWYINNGTQKIIYLNQDGTLLLSGEIPANTPATLNITYPAAT